MDPSPPPDVTDGGLASSLLSQVVQILGQIRSNMGGVPPDVGDALRTVSSEVKDLNVQMDRLGILMAEIYGRKWAAGRP